MLKLKPTKYLVLLNALTEKCAAKIKDITAR